MTTSSSKTWRDPTTLSAVGGLIGALTMLAGDLLLYLHFAPLPSVHQELRALVGPRQAILLATREQLIVSTLLGPIAAVLYLAGAWHVFARLRVGSTRWARVAGVLFGITAILSGAYHALWGPFGLAAQFANAQTTLPTGLLESLLAAMNVVIGTSTLVVLPLLLVMTIMVAAGKSDYPRWSAVLNPFLLFAVGTGLLTPVAAGLPSPYGAVLLGGLFNAVMALFFLMSLLTVFRPSDY